MSIYTWVIPENIMSKYTQEVWVFRGWKLHSRPNNMATPQFPSKLTYLKFGQNSGYVLLTAFYCGHMTAIAKWTNNKT